MGAPNLIGNAAAENGMSEGDFLAHLLESCPEAKDIAALLEISPAAVSAALARNGFVRESRWVRVVPEMLETA